MENHDIPEALKEALKPFLIMARACANLHDREAVVCRPQAGKLIYLDAADFRRLENAVSVGLEVRA